MSWVLDNRPIFNKAKSPTTIHRGIQDIEASLCRLLHVADVISKNSQHLLVMLIVGSRMNRVIN